MAPLKPRVNNSCGKYTDCIEIELGSTIYNMNT